MVQNKIKPIHIPWPGTPGSLIKTVVEDDQNPDTQVVKTSWNWATITSLSPLQIQLDGTSEPLAASPVSFVDPLALSIGSRVWVQSYGLRRYIHSVSRAQAAAWTPCTLLVSGTQSRSNDPTAWGPRVMRDAQGYVHFFGHLNPNGLSGLTGAQALIQMPIGYWPQDEQRWMGFQTGAASTPYGGFIGSGDGRLYLQIESGAARPTPTTHWCILVQPWLPQ